MESPKGAPTSSLKWRISSHCNGGSCVQVAFGDNEVALRDSKDASGPVLSFSASEWRAFLKAAKSGELERP
ncbi:DUF397 domain-containing protein [Microbispora corallina]|uniref:DUF397 domain-containing protein n=1 Tax=Microbispora corallina TaxID=83302 RepID=A0ABQ4FXU2_9ACTN|nr:DUF397 domain-containing protein [Microbispora corallina]GIH39585.1 DUF397 domain-containing protein [Microbispora corallina]